MTGVLSSVLTFIFTAVLCSITIVVVTMVWVSHKKSSTAPTNMTEPVEMTSTGTSEVVYESVNDEPQVLPAGFNDQRIVMGRNESYEVIQNS